jgi:hypothetical protein
MKISKQTKMIACIVGIALVATYLYKKKKGKIVAFKKTNSPNSDNKMANFVKQIPIYTIGPYNYNTGQTWIYDGFANGSGYWVNGYAGQEGQYYQNTSE